MPSDRDRDQAPPSPYDVVSVGGGPAGLAAALALGRACRRVLVCDAGPRRNAAAARVHNFVTRDGTPPDELRAIGRAQLAAYPDVEVRDAPVLGVAGPRGALQVTVGGDVVAARRLLLCTGMVDELLPLDGFRELWGHAVFQCPYCHGWEARGRRWGYLVHAAGAPHLVPFAIQLRAWTPDVVVFTHGDAALPAEARARLEAAGVRLAAAPTVRLIARGQGLEAVELADGTRVPCEALFAHPPQQQTALVRALGLDLDDDGLVRTDPMSRETSRPGIYAAGDLTTRMQAALPAAAAGMQAAAAINVDLALELAAAGAR